MNSLNGVATRLGYLLALGIVAALSLVEFVLLARVTADTPKQTRVISIAARQGIEAERIVEISRELVTSSDSTDRSALRSLLRSAADQMQANQRLLQTGNTAINPSGWPPPSVQAIEDHGPFFINARVADFVFHARALASASETSIARVNRDFLYNVDMDDSLVYALDLVVNAYLADSAARQTNLVTAEGIALVIVLATLVGEIFVIFRPMERAIERRQNALAEQTANLARAQRAAHVGSWERDLRTAQTTCSDELYRIYGVAPGEAEVSEQALYRYLDPADVEAVRLAQFRAKASHQPYAIDCRIINAQGARRWVDHLGEFQYAPDGQAVRFLGTAVDITDRKLAEEGLAHQASHDALTGLLNRSVLLDRLRQAMQQAKSASSKVAVLFVDLDHFKSVNDTLGHEAGDYVLVEAARRLSALLRESDTVARTGGDQFVVVLPDVSGPEDVLRVIHKVSSQLAAIYVIDDQNVYLSASIGISFSGADATTPEEVIRNADMAMYQAKETEPNDFRFYTSSMRFAAVQRSQLETEMRRAIENHEFVVYYQAIIGSRSGRVLGAEALIRWNHPTSGLVAPGDFVPIAEANGLIIPIGAWVLQSACAQAQAWRTSLWPDFRISVNMSARQLRQTTLLSTVERALSDSGLDSRALELELTESAVMSDMKQGIQTMNALRSIGSRIAIDDFGTGYSSLAYLKNFPVNLVKIDRAFVTGLPADRGDCAIVSAVTNLAHDLGLDVTAEGIETEAQADFLTATGCDNFQGFLYSRPVPAAVLEATFARGAAFADAGPKSLLALSP